MCAANVTDAEKAIVNAIEKTLQSDFDKKFSLPVLVKMYGINMHRLTEIFLIVTGVTITHYRILQRIEAAKKLLTATNESVDDIADQVGYQGARSLEKVFKQLTGCTPTEYRELHK
jgi:transcriptional regulator GlxA family with amidase domain